MRNREQFQRQADIDELYALANRSKSGLPALVGVGYVDNDSAEGPTLSATQQCAACYTSLGPILPVTFPVNPTPGMLVAVWDSGDDASTNNITVQTTDGSYIQSPYTWAYGPSPVVLDTDSVVVIWSWDSQDDEWQVVSALNVGTPTPTLPRVYNGQNAGVISITTGGLTEICEADAVVVPASPTAKVTIEGSVQVAVSGGATSISTIYKVDGTTVATFTKAFSGGSTDTLSHTFTLSLAAGSHTVTLYLQQSETDTITIAAPGGGQIAGGQITATVTEAG